MQTTLSLKTTDVREFRRRCAWNLHQQGLTQEQIAKALGVTQGAVSQWITRRREQGPQRLCTRKPPGAPARLSPEQKARIPALLSPGAESFGFRGDLWTRPRIAAVILQEFGVRYHPSYVGRLLKDRGWSRHKPARRAIQREEGAIARWRDERWPALKKSAQEKDASPSLSTNPASTCCPAW